jgi:hypothetical protein
LPVLPGSQEKHVYITLAAIVYTTNALLLFNFSIAFLKHGLNSNKEWQASSSSNYLQKFFFQTLYFPCWLE